MSNSGPDCFHVGDIGVAIIADLGIDLSDMTSGVFYVQKPTGTLVTWTGTQEGSSRLRYVNALGDFNEEGDYTIQVKLTLPTGTLWSSKDVFTIEPALSE